MKPTTKATRQPAKRKAAANPSQPPRAAVAQAMKVLEGIRGNADLADFRRWLLAAYPQAISNSTGEIISANPPEAATAPLPPISVTLSPEASELVRWYMETVGHRAGDTVDGAVFAMLTSAKEAHAVRPKGDEGFDMLLRATLESRDRTADSLSFRITRRATVELDDKATLLLRRECQQAGQDARDLVSAAVVFMLAEEEESDNDEHSDSGVALAAATARRREEAA